MTGVLLILFFFAFLPFAIWVLSLLYGIRRRQMDQERQRAADLNRIEDRLAWLLRDRKPTAAAAPAEKPLAAEKPAAPAPVPVPAPAPAQPVTAAARPQVEPPALPAIVPVTPKAEPAPAPQPAVDSAASRALRAAWNWLIVGEEFRRPGVSMEQAVATNWLIRLGVLVLVVGIGFFLKYSIEKGLLGPQARVALCFVAGGALVAGGVRLFGKRYHILGQGLVGAGLATLYFAVFAAAGLFRLVPMTVGFLLMAGVTVTAGILAVRYGTLLLAILGTLGGYLTPVMLATPDHNAVWLFGYLLLLAIGVTGVAWRQRWTALTFLSFACHTLVFFQAVHWVPHGADFATTMPFFAAYFVVFTSAIFLPGIARDRTVSALEPIGLFLVAAVFYYGGYELVRGTFSKAAVAWVTIGMAAYYTGHVCFLLRRTGSPRAFLASFLGLAAGSLALTLPLLLSGSWLTMSWAVLAAIAMWTALKLQSAFLRGLALALHAFVACKLGVLDLADAYDGTAPASLSAYWPVLIDRAMQFGVPVASFWLSSRLLARMPPSPDREAPRHGGAWGVICLVVMYLLLFLVLNFEGYRLGGLLWMPGQLVVLTLIWVAFGLHLLARSPRLHPMLCATLAALALLAIAMKFLVDFGHWGPDVERAVYAVHYQQGGGVVRLVDVAAVLGYLALAWHAWRRGGETRGWALACGYTALAILFLHLTFETATFFDQYVPGFRGGSVSVCWGLFAFGLILSGIRWQVRTLRYLGLGLFCAVIAKIFLVDLNHLASVYRIAAFVVLGIVLLLAAFVYLRQARPDELGGNNKDAP
jgi:uncharacterized membrane protein